MPSSSSSRSSSSFSSLTAHRSWLGPLLFSSTMFFRRNNQSLPKCSLPSSSCHFSPFFCCFCFCFFHMCSCEQDTQWKTFLFTCLSFLFWCVSWEQFFFPPLNQALSVWSKNRPAYVKAFTESVSYLSLSPVPLWLLECWLFFQYPIVHPRCRVPVCNNFRFRTLWPFIFMLHTCCHLLWKCFCIGLH